MIYQRKPPEVKLDEHTIDAINRQLKKDDKAFQSAHSINDVIVILYYRVLPSGKKSHGQVDLDKIIKKGENA